MCHILRVRRDGKRLAAAGGHRTEEAEFRPGKTGVSVCLSVCLSVSVSLRACARASNPATQAFIRVRDVRTVTFIKRLEAMKADPRMRDPQLHALIHCFNGNFTAASQAYCSIGMHAQAIEMFSELRM